ncbi:MAG: SDR family NAD(P)-dependent oxidoreductase [Nitrososphaeraceae archaeon]
MRKSIIVTGASSGIGRATVIKLVESGYQVFGLARSYEKLVVALSPESPSKENKKDLYVPIEFDITKPKTFDDVLNNIIFKAKGNTIYGLVNNAGYVEPGAIEDITMDNLRSQFETNFFGLVGFTKKFLPLMMRRSEEGRMEGRIVNVSSLAGLISLPLIGAYSATKHALEAISEALGMELWNTNIRIITINPGVIETNIYDVLKAKIDDIINDNDNHSRFIGSYSKYFIKKNYVGLKSSAVADVICNAISSPNPKQRYIIGSNKEKLAVRLRPLIPDMVFYSLVAKQIQK